ncbi:hypothetical protein VSS37_03730 [Candidatus Thiothrix sp. Deng01]|uniref:Uncharacterized protein n=1 Tax=Candidatus Thiothrix phosphatis TaxID=3112415 RepID=A0ABU6CTB7_9GAMM|nr:hypothetical protein [Candidatus Thiothrix sp. Deng01]MEB4590081.1 hypothetical protein [Candidatus Thiothrix sp. Deng01]
MAAGDAFPPGTWVRAANGVVHGFSPGMALPKGAELFVVPADAEAPDDVAVVAGAAPGAVPEDAVKPAGKKRAGG